MKKAVKAKLTLSKETIASLESGKLAEAAGAVFSELWEKTTCLNPA